MLVTLERFFDPWEARVLQARLRAEGVPATVAGDGHAIVNWPIGIALGGVALQVPSMFAGEARAMLDDYRSGLLQEPLLARWPEQERLCPRCGAEDPHSRVPWKTRLLVLLCTAVAMAPFPARASLLCCRRCGCRWKRDA